MNDRTMHAFSRMGRFSRVFEILSVTFSTSMYKATTHLPTDTDSTTQACLGDPRTPRSLATDYR